LPLGQARPLEHDELRRLQEAAYRPQPSAADTTTPDGKSRQRSGASTQTRYPWKKPRTAAGQKATSKPPRPRGGKPKPDVGKQKPAAPGGLGRRGRGRSQTPAPGSRTQVRRGRPR
jgi:hypothetical protein